MAATPCRAVASAGRIRPTRCGRREADAAGIARRDPARELAPPASVQEDAGYRAMPPLVLDSENLASILSQATGLPVTGSRPHVRLPRAACVQRLQLSLDGDDIVLSTWPAELQDQARAFYGDPSRVARVLELASSGAWSARPNGHLSHWLASPERRWYFKGGSLDAAQYMRRWQADLSHVHSYRRDDVATELWPWLLRRRYVGERDRDRMEDFLARARPDVHLRPGVELNRRWSTSDAQRLHERSNLTGAVREAVDAVLDTLGEPPLAYLDPPARP